MMNSLPRNKLFQGGSNMKFVNLNDLIRFDEKVNKKFQFDGRIIAFLADRFGEIQLKHQRDEIVVKLTFLSKVSR